MEQVYLDNAATSYPKAPGVGENMKYFIENIGCNINRGIYINAQTAVEIVLETRELLSRLFNFSNPENVIFTMNITQSLNFLIKGLLKRQDHCIVSSMEHNAVMRPLLQLEKKGVEFTRIPCDNKGRLNSDDLYKEIRANTKAVIINHASNVCGTILPIDEIGRICRENGIIFIVDTAQTAGIQDIDFEKSYIDALAFTGHKGLLGPQGIGGFIITDSLAEKLEPLVSGGTGSLSDSEEVPSFLPDRFEPGTQNLPGIFGLNAALLYLEKEGIDSIRDREIELTGMFLKEIGNMEGIEIIGIQGLEGRTAVVSIDCKNRDNAEISYELDKNYGIMTRCGLHCAPSAHKTLGTFPKGTVRFSFSHFNNEKEVNYTIDSIMKILKQK